MLIGKKGIFCGIMALILALSGCSRQVPQNSVAAHVVRSIHIQWEEEPAGRFYNTDAKMEKILLYIRRLKPLSSADTDPEALEGPTVRITLVCADNSTKVYRQKQDRFFQSGSGPWQQMREDKGALLWQILADTPSDPPEPQFPAPLLSCRK